MIETKRMNLHKELYFLINTQKSASISFDQMTMLKEVPKKLKPYFDYVLQHYFIDDVKQHDSVDFDTFLDLCVACDSISTNVCCTTANDQSIISQSSKTES